MGGRPPQTPGSGGGGGGGGLGGAPVSDAEVVAASPAALAAWAAAAGEVLGELGGWGLGAAPTPGARGGSSGAAAAAAVADATALLRNRLRWLAAARRPGGGAAPAAAAAAASAASACAADAATRPHPPPTPAPAAPTYPLVAYEGGVTRVVPPYPVAVTDGDGLPVGVRVQLPLAPGWACTVHAAQGRGLPALVADLAPAFGPGMVYVALSRAVGGGGVALRSFDPDRVVADGGALAFYAALEAKGGGVGWGEEGVDGPPPPPATPEGGKAPHHAKATAG